MIRRFDKEAFHFLETRIKNFADQIRKNTKPIIIAASAVVILAGVFSIPEFIINNFQKEAIKLKIKEYINLLPLAISYDGITFSAYNGVELYNLRVSAEKDFSKENVILQSPVFRLRFDIIELVTKHKIKLSAVEIEKGVFEYRQIQHSLYGDFAQKLASFLKKEQPPVIYFINSKVIFTSKRNSGAAGGKFQWIFNNVDGEIKSENGALAAAFRYNEPDWGRLNMTYESANCETCKTGDGVYNFKFKNLPLTNLNELAAKYVKDLRFTKGVSEGSIDYEYIPEDGTKRANIQTRTTGSLTLNDAEILLGDKKFIQCNYFNATGDYKVTSKSTLFEMNGQVDSASVSYKVNIEPGGDTIESYNFSLISDSPDKPLYLPYGFVMEGLQKAEMDIVKTRKNSKNYIIRSGRLSLSDGNILNLNYKPFNLNVKQASIKAGENNIQAKISLGRNKSDINLSWEGQINPYEKDIITYYYPYGGFEKKAANETITAYEINGAGSLNSKNLLWNDLSEYYATILESWNNLVSIGHSQGWRASIVRERKWFNRFVSRMNVKFDVNIQNAFFERNDENKKSGGLSLKGETFFQNSIFQMTLNDEDGANKIFLRWNAQQNYPMMSGEIKFFFSSQSLFTNLWIPNDIVENFTSGAYSYTFTSSGERPVDLITTHRGEGKFEFEQARLTPLVKKVSKENDLPLNWMQLKGDIIRNGEKAWLFNIRAEQATYSAWARGIWTYDLNAKVPSGQWEFYPSLREKKPSEN